MYYYLSLYPLTSPSLPLPSKARLSAGGPFYLLLKPSLSSRVLIFTYTHGGSLALAQPPTCFLFNTPPNIGEIHFNYYRLQLLDMVIITPKNQHECIFKFHTSGTAQTPIYFLFHPSYPFESDNKARTSLSSKSDSTASSTGVLFSLFNTCGSAPLQKTNTLITSTC